MKRKGQDGGAAAHARVHRDELSAGTDAQGRLADFRHRFAGSAVIARYALPWVSKGLDGDAAHAAELPCGVPHRQMDFVRHEPPGPACSPATCAVWGPRTAVLGKNPRLLKVLQLAAQQANCGAPLATGRAVASRWSTPGAVVPPWSRT